MASEGSSCSAPGSLRRHEMTRLAVRPVLEMTPNELMLDRSLRIAGVLLCHNGGELRGDYCD